MDVRYAAGDAVLDLPIGWSRVDSFLPDVNPEEPNLPRRSGSSAAEWVGAKKDGGYFMISDESFGGGILLLGPAPFVPAPPSAPTASYAALAHSRVVFM